MDDKDRYDLEKLWDDLLSEQATLVRQAFAALQPGERPAVLAHLERMVSEEGWQAGQRRSAQAALDALDQV